MENKKYFRSSAVAAVLVATVGLFSAGHVSAVAFLSATSGAAGGPVDDNSPGDLDPTTGVVLVTGAVGAWNVNVNTGITKPVLGSSTAANMDLSSVEISTTGTSDDIYIEFWDFDFSANGNTVFSTAIGGTVQNANIAWVACVGDANANAGECSDFITDGNFFGEGAFSANSGGSASLGEPYSIGLIVAITPEGSGPVSASFDFQITEVPVPAAAWLFGSALLGLIGIKRRK